MNCHHPISFSSKRGDEIIVPDSTTCVCHWIGYECLDWGAQARRDRSLEAELNYLKTDNSPSPYLVTISLCSPS